jgi:putative NIF3 family GTP cyclohydrolase 1 type 2
MAPNDGKQRQGVSMTKGILGDREKALEDNYFRQEEAKLVEKLRQNARLDEIAAALRDKLQVDDPELLMRTRQLGVTVETAPAFFLAPLVQVAWAGGSVTSSERETVLGLARGREIDPASPAYAQLVSWLESKPSDELFDTALEVLRSGFSVLPPDERRARVTTLVDACHKVAEAAGSHVATLLGMRQDVTRAEESVVETINNKLRIGTGESA